MISILTGSADRFLRAACEMPEVDNLRIESGQSQAGEDV
jgi:hypothetical protein